MLKQKYIFKRVSRKHEEIKNLSYDELDLYITHFINELIEEECERFKEEYICSCIFPQLEAKNKKELKEELWKNNKLTYMNDYLYNSHNYNLWENSVIYAEYKINEKIIEVFSQYEVNVRSIRNVKYSTYNDELELLFEMFLEISRVK